MKYKFLNYFFTAIALNIFAASCDILRFAPFEVVSWAPGTGFHSENISEITLTFSLDPDRASVERNFSLSADGESIRGSYQWKGNKLVFIPFAAPQTNKDYTITVSSGAKTKSGLSMDEDFTGSFSTRLDKRRPVILSFMPENYSEIEKNEIICFIEFSIPVSINSLRSNISFNPSMPGAWHLEKEETLAVFTPSEPWPQGKRFEMRMSGALTGSNGMSMEKDFINIFTIGANREEPYLAKALRINGIGEKIELFCGDSYENCDWEKDDRLMLEFSTEVDTLSVGAALNADNASIFKFINETDFSKNMIFYFDKAPAFDSRFVIQIKSGIKDVYGNESTKEYTIKVFANGKKSKPPELIGIRLPLAPNETIEDELQLTAYDYDSLFSDLPIISENYPYSVKTDTWIECYFDCAQDASINLFSLMELFRIETSNNVIQFIPLLIKNENFSVNEPHSLWGKYQRIEIKGALTNTVNSGLVHFIINQGLKDNAENLSEKQFRISLIK